MNKQEIHVKLLTFKHNIANIYFEWIIWFNDS